MRILIVEDAPEEAELVVVALEKIDVAAEVTVVGDGIEAMAFLRREGRFAGARMPDLILLDLNLPRMNGRSVLEELKEDERLRQIPVIVLSNSDLAEDIEYVYRHNGNCYVVKPPNMQEMYSFVAALQQFWGERVRFSPAPD